MQIRRCPRCSSERPATEFLCQGDNNGTTCNWDLTNEPRIAPGQISPPTGSHHAVPILRRCPNDHPYDEGDIICAECGVEIVEGGHGGSTPEEASSIELPTGWQLVEALKRSGEVRERFVVRRDDGDQQGVLTLYREGSEPDSDVQAVLRSMDVDHVPRLIDTGRLRGRSYEIVEYVTGGSFDDIVLDGSDRALLNKVVDEIGRALDDFAQVGLRHRDLRPDTILIRSMENMDLVIDGFGSARLSNFDLDVESPLEISRYMAPEAIAGGVAAASDWWSLGMMLLEKITKGACFEGIHEQAFLINMLSNGVPLPEDLHPDVDLLLRGLLAKDRESRWQWTQVKTWLDGEPVEAPDTGWRAEIESGPPIDLGGVTYRSVRRYALAASEQANWDEACQQFTQGTLLNWLGELKFHGRGISALRSVRNSDLHLDDQFSIGLKILNSDMPLIRRGVIISPAWLIENPTEGYRLISSQAPDLLDDLDAEPWIAQLNRRDARVREVARYHEVGLNEERLQIFLVATSISQLKAQWEAKRRVFPDTDHHGLATIMERRQISEEDLIILCAAEMGQFRTTQEIVEEAALIARQSGVEEFNSEGALILLGDSTKGEILRGVEERIRDFATCSISELDKWADQFRIESRLSLPKALVLLDVPAEQWTKPPRHAYVKQLITYFEQKLSFSIRQGPLSRMTIAKTTAKIDLAELETTGQSAESLVNRLLKRSEYSTTLDPQSFFDDQNLERRIRNLERQSTLYKRDTGIDGLYMGFPFLLMQLPNRNTKPRIAPLLLWPIKLIAEVGQQGQIRLAFDKDREEVRFNPAIESYIGSDAFKRWNAAAKTILARSVTAKDVIDEFGRIVTPRSRDLGKLPGTNYKVPDGPGEIVSSAVLFHVKFIGQAIVEDLRQLRDQRIEGSALEPMLRMSKPDLITANSVDIPEAERFLTANSDPSQEKAVLDARSMPGLVISGPPGTGKSQTIVNIIADAIGRKKSVLVVCQKQAALEVVQKRLQGDGLGDRVVMITDENRDRQPVVKLVREQVESLLRDGIIDSRTKAKRLEVATQIQEIEAELDSQHRAMHEIDDMSGLSYRELIAELVALEGSARKAVNCLGLRKVLEKLDKDVVARAKERCSALASLWLCTRYEGSPLVVLKSFGWDDETIRIFTKDFLFYSKAEAARLYRLQSHSTDLRLDDAFDSRDWLQKSKAKIDKASDSDLSNLSKWFGLFEGSDSTRTRAAWCLNELVDLGDVLGEFEDTVQDVDMHDVTVSLAGSEFQNVLRRCRKVIQPAGALGKFSPVRPIRRWLLNKWLESNALDFDDDSVKMYLACLELDNKLRPLRTRLAKVQKTLGVDSNDTRQKSHANLHALVHGHMSSLRSVNLLASLVLECPLRDKAIEAAKTLQPNSIRRFAADIEAACDLAEDRVVSRLALAKLENWIQNDWIAIQRSQIGDDSTDLSSISAINAALTTVADYQQFRARSDGLSADEWAIFGALRQAEKVLRDIPEQELSVEVRRTIDREQRLSWKASIERRRPSILSDRSELESKVRSLAVADDRMRVLNRHLLGKGINVSVLANRGRWDDITRLTGVRMKRLREFIRLGMDLGLSSVRPVWLMNPEVVSRVLPLARGLFDVVVFDEASQMPIEHAIPALYRGSLAVVSGDEKQLPPTSFFSSKIESDEAETGEGEMPDEDATDEEIEALEEVWDRREIKNCPDLLALANASLPNSLLEIHYRSQYRELISFSNHSFYAGRLHVPARHPRERVLQIKPIQVIRVDGIYEQQVNSDEADKVVKTLENIWARPKTKRPTVGVVTFNRKQADLILERMEEYAEENEAFRSAYAEENERFVDGEDMRFFVKNVENVQGDERDIMVFSTTFGRNSQGTFRRNFGVLGQKGGERRLNVAITRAKRKIVIVTSMPVNEISDFLVSRRQSSSPRDFLQAYLHYSEQLSNGNLEVASSLLNRLNPSTRDDDAELVDTEDSFAMTVAAYIENHLKLNPIAANDGTTFGVDYAIENPKTGLFGIGIECDSPNHPLLRRARSREIWRRKVIRQSIQSIHRVSSYGWYHHRKKEQELLKNAIFNALS